MYLKSYELKKFPEHDQLGVSNGNGQPKGRTSGAVQELRAVRSNHDEVEFIASNDRMLKIKETAIRAAKFDLPVLLTGETGVGKDVVARLIHQHSALAGQPFVKVNCAALPAELVESELFGCEKGAFTGAHNSRPGKFEFANHGTIFLDEIGEFSSSTQAKLLQVLQDGSFSRLGNNKVVNVNVRIIAATNRNLEEEIERGTFRRDLYYRLNIVSLELLPLRQRRDDIPLLVDFFVKKFARKYEFAVQEIPKDLMEAFVAYDWPGNVRELQNMIKRHLVLQDQDALREDLRKRISSRNLESDVPEEFFYDDEGNPLDLKKVSELASTRVEKSLIYKTLCKTEWNKWQAAKQLRVSYKTLLNKIDKYEIAP